MSTRRLEPKELQRAFARGPRQELDFLVPARAPAVSPAEPTGAASDAPPAKPRRKRAEAPSSQAAPRPARRSRTRKTSTKKAPVGETPQETGAPAIDVPAVDVLPVVAPAGDAPVPDLRPDRDAGWAPATAPWPRPTLLDRALRRFERFVGRMLCAA